MKLFQLGLLIFAVQICFGQSSTLTDTYQYDGNGNVIADSHNNIAFIQYDINNLPITIYKTDGTKIEYAYDASGERVRKTVGTVNTYYIRGVDGHTEAIAKDDQTATVFNIDDLGRAERQGSNWIRSYYLKDHLGSIRMTMADDGSPLGYSDYYPFGMIMPGRSQNIGDGAGRYKFTGKERDVETQFDYFGARYYDSRIARWLAVDPSADKTPGWTPYRYGFDNPMRFFDPDGNKELQAIKYARDKLMNKTYASGLEYYDGGSWTVKYEDRLVCNEFVARAYYGAGYKDYPGPMDLQVNWFNNHGWFTTDVNVGEVGDVMFFGNVKVEGERHEVIISDVMDVEVKGAKVRKYRIAHSGSTGSIEYKKARWRTASEVGDEFAAGLDFVGIGSKKESIAQGSSVQNGSSRSSQSWWERMFEGFSSAFNK